MSRILSAALFIAFGLTSACAGRSTPAVATAADRLTSATVTFTTLDDGKDAKSAVTAQLLRNGSELAAEGTAAGTEFDDGTTSAPVALKVRGPYERSDADTGQLRLRLTPDGDDTWTFNVGLTLRFADETQREYRWQSIRLDEASPERTLVLSNAETP